MGHTASRSPFLYLHGSHGYGTVPRTVPRSSSWSMDKDHQNRTVGLGRCLSRAKNRWSTGHSGWAGPMVAHEPQEPSVAPEQAWGAPVGGHRKRHRGRRGESLSLNKDDFLQDVHGSFSSGAQVQLAASAFLQTFLQICVIIVLSVLVVEIC